MKSHDAVNQVNTGFLNFLKAFDIVPYNKLLNKLDEYRYGVRRPLNKWLQIFLTQRTMKIVVDEENSAVAIVDS